MALVDDILARHAACPVLSSMQIRWLRSLGVPTTALHQPDVLVRASVVYQGNCFLFEDEVEPGEPTISAVVALAYAEDGVPGDLVAWSPRTGMVATWLRRISYLGDAFGPRLDSHGGVIVHPEPLSWLRADREGIVIIDPVLAREQLRDAGPFTVDGDTAFAEHLEAALTLPGPDIIVLRTRQEAA